MPSPAATADPVDSSILSARYSANTVGMVALVSLHAFEALAVAAAMPTVAEALDGLRLYACLLYTSPSPRDKRQSRMPASA